MRLTSGQQIPISTGITQQQITQGTTHQIQGRLPVGKKLGRLPQRAQHCIQIAELLTWLRYVYRDSILPLLSMVFACPTPPQGEKKRADLDRALPGPDPPVSFLLGEEWGRRRPPRKFSGVIL